MFLAGHATAEVLVLPVNDAITEAPERVDIVIDEPDPNEANMYTIGNPSSQYITLLDNDDIAAYGDYGILFNQQPILIYVLDNDVIPIGGASIISHTSPQYGSVSLGAGGVFTYSYTSPSPDRADSFTYTIADGSGFQATATVDVEYAPEMDDVPVIAPPESDASFQVAHLAGANNAFEDIEDVKTALRANADADAILDAAVGDGVTIVAGATVTGGKYDPVKKVITLQSSVIRDFDTAIGILLYELLRWKFDTEQIALDKKAKAATIGKDAYAMACEKLSYKYMKNHHTIASAAVANGDWGPNADVYAPELEPGGKYSTEDKYIQSAKKTGHYSVFEDRYDALRKMAK